MSSQTEEEIVEPNQRLADPENYNLRRRLRQIHDAREFVKEVKNQSLGKELSNPRQNRSGRNRAVAEAVSDYAAELFPILERQERAEEFRDEEIPRTELSVGEYLESRGAPNREPLPYTDSMRVWRIVNQYFEEVAGPKFEDEGLIKERNFDATGEHPKNE